MRVAKEVILKGDERERLECYARGRKTPARVVERARIVLAAAEGKQDIEIAERLGISRMKAARWRKRFLELGVAGIERDATRPGRTPKIAPEAAAEIIRIATQETPPNATHWSSRTMAKVAEVSASSVLRVWRAHGIKPHIVKGFKLSRDPAFVEKLEDVVGLYMNPPANAIVLSVDEKSQIQALDRTQPMLPFGPGHPATATHDYVRNGTTTLFAAMNTLNGQVISKCLAKHTHVEWLAFLKQINRETPPDKDLHLIVDNYATHKHERVRGWLRRHPRFHVHFTPTGASWLNMVERFFRDLTDKQIRRGAFPSVRHLIAAIERYIEIHNLDPKPFIWTAKASDILEKVKRARSAAHNKRRSV